MTWQLEHRANRAVIRRILAGEDPAKAVERTTSSYELAQLVITAYALGMETARDELEAMVLE